MSDFQFKFIVKEIDPPKRSPGCLGKIIPGDKLAWLGRESYGVTERERIEFSRRLKPGMSEITVRLTTDYQALGEKDLYLVEICPPDATLVDSKLAELESTLQRYLDNPDANQPPVVTMTAISLPQRLGIYGEVQPGIEAHCPSFDSAKEFEDRWNPVKDFEFHRVVRGDRVGGIVQSIDRNRRLIEFDPQQLIEMVDQKPNLVYSLFNVGQAPAAVHPTVQAERSLGSSTIDLVSSRWQFKCFLLVEDDQPLAECIKEHLESIAFPDSSITKVFAAY